MNLVNEQSKLNMQQKGMVVNIGVRKGGFQGSKPPLKNDVQAYIHGNK